MERRRIGVLCRERILRPQTWSKEFRVPQPRRPENRTTPWVARLGACHTLQGAAANNAIRTKDATHAQDRPAQGRWECGSPPT